MSILVLFKRKPIWNSFINLALSASSRYKRKAKKMMRTRLIRFLDNNDIWIRIAWNYFLLLFLFCSLFFNGVMVGDDFELLFIFATIYAYFFFAYGSVCWVVSVFTEKNVFHCAVFCKYRRASIKPPCTFFNFRAVCQVKLLRRVY